MTTPESGSIPITLHCRYVLHVPESTRNSLLILALHGYGSNPEMMLRLTVPTVGREHVVAAIQAPFQQYLSMGANAEVGYNWGVRTHHEEAIRLHQSIVFAVRDELGARFDIPPDRCVLVGFSQPVGLNYRLLGTHPDSVGAVIGLCGGVPRDWEESKYQHFATPILHIARSEDEFYPTDTANRFTHKLRAHASNVEFHMLPGGHRFPSNAVGIVQPWLKRIFPGV